MKALKFKSKIKNNRILIPSRLQSELKSNQDKDVRVIVLMDDSEIYDDLVFNNQRKNNSYKVMLILIQFMTIIDYG